MSDEPVENVQLQGFAKLLVKVYDFGKSMGQRGLDEVPEGEPWALNEAFDELERLLSDISTTNEQSQGGADNE
jgi:hypothetical protein